MRRHREVGNGLRPVSAAVAPLVDRIAEAAIRRALGEGDTAKAERLRRDWRNFVEERINGA